MVVGHSKVSFLVHKAPLRSRSSFFESASRGEWIEAKSKTISLSDTDPEIFETFVHWAYTSEVDLSLLQPPGEQIVATYLQLTKLWIFADKHLDFELCNRVIDLTVEGLERCKYAGVGVLQFIWPNTSPGSKLRKLHLDVMSSYTFADYIKEYAEETPKELLLDLAVRYLGREETDAAPDELNMERIGEDYCCRRYHIHEDEKVCGK